MSTPSKNAEFWSRLAAAILSAIATALGVTSCMGFGPVNF
ncbi:MAG: smalltalk protein [Prevotella sp.]|nr:smalltalk protein [Prevotella sp.]